MKKLTCLITLLSGLLMTSCLMGEIENINNRLDQIEKTQIASLSDQVTNIKISLAKLEGVDNSIQIAMKGLENLVDALRTQLESSSVDTATKQDLQKKIADIQALIAQLTVSDEALDDKIADLQAYVDEQLAQSRDWAESTFATLTQYYELEAALLALSGMIGQPDAGIAEEYTAAIAEAIEESEASMKDWVNKTLAESYYDIAAIDAKLLLLENKISEGDAELADQIADQKAALEQALKDFGTKIQAGIEAAVAEGGVINVEIARQIESAMENVNVKLAVIDNMIAAINADIAAIRGDIASIQEQIDSIKGSISDLQSVDEELDDYLAMLSEQYDALSAAYDRLEELINSGSAPDSGSGIGSSASLEEFKAAVEAQLSIVEAAIESLQKKDMDLKDQISDLQAYVDGELANNKDWAEATFATLEQYNELSDIIGSIKTQISALSEQLEARLASMATKEELDKAVSQLSSSVQADIQAAVENCNNAMQVMQQELMAACQSAISAAISNSEQAMKSWINSKLSNYYTAAQVDAMIDALKSDLEGQLDTQKAYLEGVIRELEMSLDAKIENNAMLIAQLQDELENADSQLAELASKVASNTSKIADNAQAIRSNASAISENASNIADNSHAIAVANELISKNKTLIEENGRLIAANARAIDALQDRPTVNDGPIPSYVDAIYKNADDIAANAELIAVNAAAIVNNATAISDNAADIQQLKEDLEKAKKDITEAYQEAIRKAVESMGGQLGAQEIAALNSRITSEVETINEALSALESRVAACEKDIKTIKNTIYNLQTQIEDMQEQISTILSRIQSISYIPEYSDGSAAVNYTNNGTLTPGNITLDFNVLPSGTAAELAKVWQAAVSAEAVYTMTKASVEVVPLSVLSVVADGDYMTVVVSGQGLKDEFYLGRCSANLSIKISDGNNERRTEFIPLSPWTTDVIAFADSRFKAYLLEKFDTDSDGEISRDEALEVTQIDCSYRQIEDLGGIEHFSNLTSLNASFNKIGTLDLRNNSRLAQVDVKANLLTSLHVEGLSCLSDLNCSDNKLIELDITASKDLTHLDCSNNNLGVLNLSDNKALEYLQCSRNNIATLNLKNLTALEALYCRSNSLSVIDISKNTLLKELDCSSNGLTTLNLNKNTVIETVYCRSNALTSLYLNACGDLALLDCSDNSIQTLDLAALKKLETLNCSENDLSSLDVSANPALDSVDCSDNPSLAKLWVKDQAHQQQMTITKDEATNIFFNAGGLVFPDKALEAYMLANYDDDYDGVISIAEADNVTMVNCANKGISDLSGLEACTNLVYFNCSNNNIKVVDCHTFVALESLSCYGNPVEVLDLSNCAELQSLFIRNVSTNAVSGTAISVDGYDQAAALRFSVANTPFKTLSIVNSPVLTDLNVHSNDNLDIFNGYGNTALTSLSLSPYFKEVHAYGCSVLEGTDVSAISGLTVLDLHGCNLQTLNVDSNPELVTFDCSSNQLTRLNVDNNTVLVTLKVNGNNLTQFKVANNTALETLNVSDNKLSAINVRSNTALKDLRVSNNIDITVLNVKNNPALETLYADRLSISEINLVENSAIKRLSLLDDNNLTALYPWPEFSDLSTGISIDHVLVMTKTDGSIQDFPIIGTRLLDTQNVAGIVFKCDVSSCYIMSLKETSCSWGPENKITDATNRTDGMANMNTIKSIDFTLSKYPAFKWCADFGADWYLPAINELETIYSNRSKLNTTLSKVGGTSLGSTAYWSSTEYGGYNAYLITYNGYTSTSYKSNSQHVRAVRAL